MAPTTQGDLVRQSSTTTGTGNFTLASINGFRNFSTVFGTGATQNVFDYYVANIDAAEWERGTGHMSNSTTLVRDTVASSSNANAAVSFSAGTKIVGNDIPAAKQLRLDNNLSEFADQGTVAQASSRHNLYAAPFDALAFSGMQVNGAMDVSQENIAAAVTLASGTPKYVVDMVIGRYTSATIVMTGQQVAPPGTPDFGATLQKCMQLKSTTGAALGAGDYAFVELPIEGYRVARLGFGNAQSQSVTVGFWVYATTSGTMAVALTNSAVNRSSVVNVNIASTTTWQWVTATFDSDSSGTWLMTTGVGMRVRLCFGSGSTYQGTAFVWNASEVFATSSTTNFFATNNNVVAVTGVVVVPGTEAPSQVRSSLIQRPYDQEVLTCQRYWEKSYDAADAPGTATNSGIRVFRQGAAVGTANAGLLHAMFKRRKRIAAQPVWYSPNSGTSGKVYDATNGVDLTATAFTNGESEATISFGFTATATPDVRGHWTADVRF